MSRCIRRLLLVAMAIAPLAEVGAQTFAASAAGTLYARAGQSLQTWGPATVPPAGAQAWASEWTPVQMSASAGAQLFSNWLSTSAHVSAAVQGSSGPGASAHIVLLLQAPVGAGVRLTFQHTVSPNGPLFTGGSCSIDVAGQVHSLTSTGTLVVDALVPSGGLAVGISQSAWCPYYSTSGSSSLSTQWSYPGVTFAGAPTPGCLGPAVCWTRGIPSLGNATFGFTCANAHPGIGGVAAIGLGGVTTPWVYDGVTIWLDPLLPIATTYFPSSPTGEILHPLAIPNHPSFAGLQLFAQWVLFEPPGCMPAGLSGSNAVRAVIQA